jgi:hypothetical protein
MFILALVLGASGLGGCAAGSGAAGLVLLAVGAATALVGCGDPGPKKFRCCVNGQQTVCACDAGPSTTCNYSLYVVADSGLCMYPPDPPSNVRLDAAPDAPEDAAAPDAPIDATLDLGGPDLAVGVSYPCCAAGRLETCYCPPLTACNYGLVVNCGDGTCYERLLPNVDPDGGSCRAGDGGGQ